MLCFPFGPNLHHRGPDYRPCKQMKGSGMVFQSSLLDLEGLEGDDAKDVTEEKMSALRKGKDEASSVLMSREYMGCYSDEKQDRVMGYKNSRMDMTTEICRAYCKEMNVGHMYYATQVRYSRDVQHMSHSFIWRSNPLSIETDCPSGAPIGDDVRTSIDT